MSHTSPIWLHVTDPLQDGLIRQLVHIRLERDLLAVYEQRSVLFFLEKDRLDDPQCRYRWDWALSGRFQPSSQYYSVQFILLIAKLISVVWGCISLGKLSMIILVVAVSRVQQVIDLILSSNNTVHC